MNTTSTTRPVSTTTCSSACDTLYRRHYANLCAFARARGCEAHEAEDAAQDLFAKLFAQGQIDRAAAITDSEGQSAFLLARMRTLLIKRWHYRTRLCRCGGAVCLSLHDDEGQAVDIADASHCPDAEMDREWARAVLERAMQRMNDELHATGRADMWDQLEEDLNDEVRSRSERSPRSGALRVALHRARRRLRDFIREQLQASGDDAACELGVALA